MKSLYRNIGTLCVVIGLGTPWAEAIDADTAHFYLSFDASLDADHARGDATPRSGRPELTTQGEGKSGEALDLRDAKQTNYTTLTYDLDENISLKEGTVQFWYKPDFSRSESSESPFVSYFLFDIPTLLRDTDNQVVRVAVTVSENVGQKRVWLLSGLTGADDTKSSSAVVDWQADEWHHIALTWTDQELTLYLDNVPVASIYSRGGLFGGNAEAHASLVGVFGVGGAWSFSSKISADGLIDEFRISDQVLEDFSRE